MQAERDRVPDELLLELGAMTLTAARTEHLSRALLRFVLQLTDYHAEVLVGRHSWDWVLRTLREVGGHDERLSEDIQQAIVRWTGEVNKVRKQRNDLVHGTVWETTERDPETGQALPKKTTIGTTRGKGGQVHHREVPAEPAYARQVTDDLHRLNETQVELVRAAGASIYGWQIDYRPLWEEW